MEIPIDENWLKTLYDILIKIYSNTEHPIVSGFPIVTDYDEGLLGACVKRGQTTINGKAVFPHILHKAAVLMHSIINFHPFVDGNKRVALLAVDFYLHWNGYRFMIPKDADDFTIQIAKGNIESLNEILFWIKRNTIRTPSTVIWHLICESEMSELQSAHSGNLTDAQRVTLFPLDAIRFFGIKIIEEKNRRLRELGIKNSNKRSS